MNSTALKNHFIMKKSNNRDLIDSVMSSSREPKSLQPVQLPSSMHLIQTKKQAALQMIGKISKIQQSFMKRDSYQQSLKPKSGSSRQGESQRRQSVESPQRRKLKEIERKSNSRAATPDLDQFRVINIQDKNDYVITEDGTNNLRQFNSYRVTTNQTLEEKRGSRRDEITQAVIPLMMNYNRPQSLVNPNRKAIYISDSRALSGVKQFIPRPTIKINERLRAIGAAVHHEPSNGSHGSFNYTTQNKEEIRLSSKLQAINTEQPGTSCVKTPLSNRLVSDKEPSAQDRPELEVEQLQ